MRTLYHEFESLEHLLANRLLPGGEEEPIRLVVFGGTGAVGGAAVMELCRLILLSRSLGDGLKGEVWATGLGQKEISKFVSRLYLAFEHEVEIEKLEPLRHYRIAGRIDLRFSILRLHIPSDLGEQVDQRMAAKPELDLPQALGEYFDDQPCPFLGFVEEEIVTPMHAAVVAIPLPSVATYTLTSIDGLLKAAGVDDGVKNQVKKRYLTTFVRGLAVIHQRHARRVVMAHTTAVGGMYRVDGGAAEIRLGFAHSSLGKKLVDKKYFADELTQLFVDQGFDVMVTAAAIGIDAVDFRVQLPSDRSITARVKDRAERADHETLPSLDLESGRILLYPSRNVAFDPPPAKSEPETEEPSSATEAPAEPLPELAATPSDDLSAVDPLTADLPEESAVHEGLDLSELDVRSAQGTAYEPEPPQDPDQLVFGRGKELIVEAAIRSGENGLFSVANCVALYNVMKVAIPEELALALVRHALFGPERRRDWFQERICYYHETENCYFALRLLDSYPELVRAHHSAFAIQAYQALGSATHQARLHTLGLLMLVLRLRELAGFFTEIADDELTEALQDLDGFFWRRTKIPSFQDLEGLDALDLAADFARLCECDSMEDAGALVGYDPRSQAVRPPGREKFLSRLATHIQRHLNVITSLGVPILYRRPDGEDRLLIGPYCAPFDAAVAHVDDLPRLWHRLAEKHGTSPEAFRDWAIVNNGFVDLRPHAFASSAKEPGPRLEEHVGRFESVEELEAWLGALEPGSYFTSSGLVALLYRLHRLGRSVTSRKVQLGTRETWKHLFRQDRHGRHLISPGLIETVRMYCEGLGKITGTEALWPGWGY